MILVVLRVAGEKKILNGAAAFFGFPIFPVIAAQTPADACPTPARSQGDPHHSHPHWCFSIGNLSTSPCKEIRHMQPLWIRLEACGT